MRKITIKELNEKINSGETLFVRFTTEWCGVCKVNYPMLKKVCDKYVDKIPFYDIDADVDKTWDEDGSEWNIKLVPTYMTFKSGAKIWEQNNFVAENILEQKVKEVI